MLKLTFPDCSPRSKCETVYEKNVEIHTADVQAHRF